MWNGSVLEIPGNHQLIMVAERDNAPGSGLTISQLGTRTSSFVFRQVIDDAAGNRGMNADQWAMKTMAHEFAHQWETNTVFGLSDHCPATSTAWNDPTVYCLLAAFDPARSEMQRANGIARFHMRDLPGQSQKHSEYFEIRRRPDPFHP